MVDIKVSTALASDLVALRKTAVFEKKADNESRQAEDNREDDAARVDVDAGAEKLANAAPTLEDIENGPSISEEAAKLLALDVRQKLDSDGQSFAGESEKTILSLFN
jgi:hypothetical protein